MIQTGSFDDGERIVEGVQARSEAICSWLAFRTGTLGVQFLRVFAEGLRQEPATRSEALTQVALERLERRGVIVRDAAAAALEATGYASFQLVDKTNTTFWLSRPDIELTPREQAFRGLLANGEPRTAADLESSLPFDPGDQSETLKPWRTEACLGHMVALNQIEAVGDSYRVVQSLE